ncbi:ricin-type beta-trefoil lectin domain protein [Streptomyces cyaneochromogenes]|nr:ricin-type beta-trefoil lectin domain protein [Streptomyces cyaneochromogenes]
MTGDEGRADVDAEERPSRPLRPGPRPARVSPLVTELLDRHWAPVLEYATLCTNSPQAAKALAQAAFRRQLDSAAGPTFPWRCHLLGAVIETAEEWDADERRFDLREGLRTEADGQEPSAMVLRRDRHLLLHGFQQLPEQLRSLLWHTEVEAEDLAEAASHAGLDLATARAKLRGARARLRAVCRQAHLDFAPEEDCRRYNRLIDVATDRSQVTEAVPDLHHHLTECAYCRAATNQLDQTPERLPLLLAEAVLGFGAEDYLTLCRARRSYASTAVPASHAPPQARPLYTPVARATMRRARRAARRRAGLLFGGIVITSGVLIGAVTGILLSGSLTGPGADAGTAEPTPTQTTSPQATPVGNPPTPVLNARFHNVATGLCLDIGNRDAVAGATAVTSTCAPVATQLWDLGPDGLLRSHADPGLCLDSAKVFELEMRPCPEAADDWAADFQFVLSDGGLLIPGRNSRLAVTPAATRQVVGVPVVLRELDASFPSGFERWLTEAGPRP